MDNSLGLRPSRSSVRSMTFQVGEYEATELIGTGGSAQVWRGRRSSTGAAVAIKIFPPGRLPAVRREAALAAAVDHPHVVAVLDVVADTERAALITEYADGGDLATLLDRRGTLSQGETLTVLLPLAAALATAHERHIVHGDVSTRNVLFDRAGRPLLADLGAGRASAELGLEVSATAPDTAPELARGGPPTAATDMFSLGSIALACLTGLHAWPADDLRDVMIQAAAGQWPDLPDEVASPALVRAVRTLLAKDPDDRPGAASLVMDLRAAGRPEPVDLSSSAPTRRPGTTERPLPGAVVFGEATGDGTATAAGSRADRRNSGAAAEREPASAGRSGRFGSATPSNRLRLPGRLPGRHEAQNADAERDSRSRAVTRIRADAVPRRAVPPVQPRRRALRAVVIALVAVSVIGLAGAAGLWWAGFDRSDPATVADLGRTVPSSLAVTRAAAAGVAPKATGGTGAGRPARIGSSSRAAAMSGAVVSTLSNRTPTMTSTRASGAAGRSAATRTRPGPAATDWAATVRALDIARARALTGRNPALLDAVYTIGSSARTADERVIAGLLSKDLRVTGARHDVRSARFVGNAPLRVAVRDSMPSYSILDAGGNVVGSTSSREQAPRILVLVSTPTGYRISEIRTA